METHRRSLSSGPALICSAMPIALLIGGVVAAYSQHPPRVKREQAQVRGDRIATPGQQKTQRQPFSRETLARVRQLGIPVGVSISQGRPISMDAGEVQSTVVPPGVKSQCPQGRLLVSDDTSMSSGRIALVDLNRLGAAPASTQVDALLTPWPIISPNAFDRTYQLGELSIIKSNDHDLVLLPTGDVLLIKMGRLRSALSPKPVWFDHTYKLGELWGPGARSALFVWRSEDCGNTFQFVSAIDTARIDDGFGTVSDGSSGYPQRQRSTDPPGSAAQPIWGMGGTDGPLVRVDPLTGRVFATIGLYGNIHSSTQPFLVGERALNRTAVMMSSDRGSTWHRVAVLQFRGWRVDIVPRGNRMLFAHNASNPVTNHGVAFVIPSYPINAGTAPGAIEAPEPTGWWGWNKLPWEHPILYKDPKKRDSTDYMNVNVAGQTILSRSPSSQNLLLAYMDTIGSSGDGYRFYRLDDQSGWLSFRPIAPVGARIDDFVLHLTAVDPGQGPVLFYWYDVDTATKQATIRGRLVTRDDQETIDFVISRDGMHPRSFDVTANRRWYGDYHTAGAYRVRERTQDVDDPYPIWAEYHYFPVWVEPDGRVHVARIEYRMRRGLPPRLSMKDLGYSLVSDRDRIVLRRPVDFSKLAVEERLQEEPQPGGDR